MFMQTLASSEMGLAGHTPVKTEASSGMPIFAEATGVDDRTVTDTLVKIARLLTS